MPSLGEQKRAASAALTWLWDNYWTHLEASFGLPSTTPAHLSREEQDLGAGGTTDRLVSMLKGYVKARKSEIKSKRRGDLCSAGANTLSSYNLRFSASPTSPPSETTQTALLRALVAQSLILPADKKRGSSMSGAFLVWDHVLLAFAGASASFFAQLLDLVIKEMRDKGRREEEREGLCEWAVHMLCSREWREARGGGNAEKALREKVLGECLTELGTWDLRLADGIVGGMEEGEGQLWRAVLDASRGDVDGEGIVVVEQSRGNGEEKEEDAEEVVIEVTAPVQTFKMEETVEPSEIQEKIKGPHKVVGLWKPKPIGWLPDGWDEDA